MNDRPHEIIGSYGADENRWPADERAAVRAALAGDAGLRTERAAAAELDAMLGEWAGRDHAAGADAGAVAARVLAPRHSRWLGWAAGGSIAAALGAAVMVFGPVTRTVAPPSAVATISEDAVFAAMFTTTPDEDDEI